MRLDGRSPLSLTEELKPLFAADRLAARAFLYSLTLEQLSEVVGSGVGHPSEIVQALGDKLFDTAKGSAIAKQKVLPCYELQLLN